MGPGRDETGGTPVSSRDTPSPENGPMSPDR